MGGDERADRTEPDPVGDGGSVGDWALPEWAHQISGAAWLFVGLAIADFVGELYFRPRHVDPLTTLDLGFFVGLVGQALPILLPAAVLWRIERPMPRFSEPLVGGSIAIALSAILSTVASAIEIEAQAGQSGDAAAPIAVLLRVAAGSCGSVGRPSSPGRYSICARSQRHAGP